jgi:hypothetical protein
MVVFEFNDGHVMALFDGAADDARNRELAKAVDAEGRRRVKAGLSDAGYVRFRDLANDVTVMPSKTAAA